MTAKSSIIPLISFNILPTFATHFSTFTHGTPAAATEKPLLDPGIHAWINAIVPEAPSRKRSAQQGDDGSRPAKRITRKVLGSTAGNIMSSKQKRRDPSQCYS